MCDVASEGESGEEPSGDGEEAIGDGEDDETTELPCLVKHLFPQNYDIFLGCKNALLKSRYSPCFRRVSSIASKKILGGRTGFIPSAVTKG